MDNDDGCPMQRKSESNGAYLCLEPTSTIGNYVEPIAAVPTGRKAPKERA